MIILIFSLYLYLDYILSFTLFNNGIYEDYREYGSFMSYSYYSSLNGIGLLMKWLLISCYPVIILNMISCGYDKNKIKKRYILCGFEGWLYEIFNSSSLLNFFIILEYSILPLIYIIIEEGGENKYYSIYRIFLYTLFGSIFMLSYIIFYYNRFGTFMLYNLDLYYMRLMSIGFLIGLLIKIPIYPFHGWLPHAHIDAPSYGSMLLGGILLKIGTYGYIVLLDYIYDEIFILCCISMTKNSIEIIREIDIKKIIAYSSIIHMSLGLIGLSSYNREGFCGGILMSLGHGWISCGLFKIIGEIQIRYGFRSIMYLRGLKERSNKELMIYLLFNSGFPFGTGYISEIMIIYGIYNEFKYFTSFIILSILLCLIYTISLINRIIYGKYSMIREENKYEIEHLGNIGLYTYILKTGICCTLEISMMSLC